MIVIKLGGSLAEIGVLKQCLARAQEKFLCPSTVIVPGGGKFADQVRMAQTAWHFDDRTAHRMALLAMQQMALLMHGLAPQLQLAGTIQEIHRCLSGNQNVLWSPDITELDRAGVRSEWDVTSDSLAAWLAGKLAADELILVKSAKIDAGCNLTDLVRRKVIDSAFPEFYRHASYQLSVINYQEF